MAMSFQQKRKLTIIFGVLFAIAIVLVTMGNSLRDAFIAPKGYAVHTPTGNFAVLDWNALMKATKPAAAKAVVPKEISGLSGQAVNARGYLLPLHAGVESAQFYLAPKPGNCYYCSPPGVSEVIEVNVAGGKQVPMTDRPVHVYGTFRVTDGIGRSIYIIEDATLTLRN